MLDPSIVLNYYNWVSDLKKKITTPQLLKNFFKIHLVLSGYGVGRDLGLTVARPSLTTSSRFHLLTKYRSAVLLPTQAKQLACYIRQSKLKPSFRMVLIYSRAGKGSRPRLS